MKIELSVVTTLYYSQAHLVEFYERIKNSIDKLTQSYEIIFVNDGSPDNSLQVVMELQKRDPNITIINLSKNFGHHKAMMTGLMHCQGQLVYLIDSDLEEEPEWLNMFHQKLLKENCDVVYGMQESRKGNWFEKISGAVYYKLLNKLSGTDFPKNVTTARLMTKRYVHSLTLHKERELMITGLFHITGYKQIAVNVKKHSHSATTYTFMKKLSLLITALTSFSDKPLLYIFYMGLIITLTSGFFIFNLVLKYLIWKISVPGWTSLIVSIWFIGGIISCFLGIIGMYISKIFTEVKQRPYTIIEGIYSSSNDKNVCDKEEVKK